MNNLLYNSGFVPDDLFIHRHLDARVYYAKCFGEIPDMHFIGLVLGKAAFDAFLKKYGYLVGQIHTSVVEKKDDKPEFDQKIVRLANSCMIEFLQGSCSILYAPRQSLFVEELASFLRRFRPPEKARSLEINLIVRLEGDLCLKRMEINKSRLDIELFYPDDFREVDRMITERLNRNQDKGLVLLHGLPGTGKTTYLRYLVGKLKKKVLFLSPSIAANLTSPDFIDLLTENPNSVLIVEDAENILLDRKQGANACVSSLLNISDGLLADFLNVQLICTFNSPATMVDQALMRKGRLIARYEFGKLEIEKARKLSAYFGFTNLITVPMTLAEIAGQLEPEFKDRHPGPVGFRARWQAGGV